jgi:predicted CopG family antitoxin
VNKVNLITIAITRENYQALKDLGKTGDSFNDVITKLLDGSVKVGLEQQPT